MKKILYSLAVAVALSGATSCDDNFLDKEPLDKYAEQAVWSDPALIELFVNNIYLGIPHGFSNIMLSSLTDESMYNADFGSSNVTKSLISPSDYSIFDENYWTAKRMQGMNWSPIYKHIRACNLFLERIETAPFESEEDKRRLTGEVHFLRAHLYHNLVSMYGGVPLITRAYGLGEDYAVPRNSYAECIDFIVAECDKAAELLPLAQNGDKKGRATKGAALALKSRALLYAASDLQNNTSWATGYSNPELIGYTDNNRTARWQAAKDAAKAVIDLGIYSLYKADPAPGDSTAQNYAEMFLKKEMSEDIFVRKFTPMITDNWDGYNPGLYNSPNGYHGWGSNTPLGQMVDAYEMKDGTKFSWSNPAHAAAPYKNRDPRFYATILYEGAKWRERPSDAQSLDPLGIIQVGFWEKWNASKNTMEVVAGLDTRKGPIEDWNGTYTGYYLRKFIDPALEAQYVKQDLPWRHFRYSEILLNYAEACLGLKQEAEAITYINMIRQRAGMPLVNDGGQALVERYRNERRVELAFEDHRYFDVRRWMVASQTYEDALGVDIRYKLNPDKSTALKPTFTVINVQDREWKPRFYFFPIKLDEMNRNNKLVQNPLY